MARPEKLFKILDSIDGRGYGAYREIGGRYDLGEFILFIDHVQADPFAAPSRIRVHVPAGVAGIPTDAIDDHAGRVAAGDFLARRLAESIKRHSRGVRGSGTSGLIEVDTPGQEILEATAVSIRPGGIVDARFYLGLPAKGRDITAGVLKKIVRGELPAIVQDALVHSRLDGAAFDRHVATARRQVAMRDALGALGLVAFVENGARLARRSPVDDQPLEGDHVVAFEAPAERTVTLELPGGDTATGLGVPRGVTLIVGGAFHGKSTLLRAIERGVYDHVPGDGRDGVVTDPTAFKVRAEDGRRVANVDISGFLRELPFHDPATFATDAASGATSQAASIVEAIAAGTRTLLFDEDTSATNFLIRDRRMQRLVPADGEPIVPLVDRVRELHERLGVSTILVAGGSGDYLDVADTVLRLDRYRPIDATEVARAIAAEIPTGRATDAPPLETDFGRRIVQPTTFGSREKPSKVRATGPRTIAFGKRELDLAALEQLVDPSQTTALAEALRIVRNDFADGHRTVEELVDLVCTRIGDEGLDCLTRRPTGGLAAFRRVELCAALNRLRSLRVARG